MSNIIHNQIHCRCADCHLHFTIYSWPEKQPKGWHQSRLTCPDCEALVIKILAVVPSIREISHYCPGDTKAPTAEALYGEILSVANTLKPPTPEPSA